MKRYFIKIASAVAVLVGMFTSCEKPNYVDPNTENVISDFYASTDGYGTNRLFESRMANDTIYVDVNYHYPVDSDTEVDLTKMLLKASIPKDSRIVPSLDGFTDLTSPKNITVVAGDGAEKKYVVVAVKQGDANLKSAKISYKQDGEEKLADGIINGDKVIFFILPGIDLSQAKFSYVLNKHASGSIKNESVVNLTSGTLPFVITAPGNKVKAYTVEVREPIKLAVGAGINRRLFFKSSADLGFSTNNNTSIAVSGDYLIVLHRTLPSVLKVYNRFTGAYVKDMYQPIASPQIFQIVSDAKGHIITTTYTGLNGTFQVYKYQNVNDTAPVRLMGYVHTPPVGVTTGDRALGRKVRAFGDFNGDAVLVSSIANTPYFYRWKLANGVIASTTPELVKMNDVPELIGVQNSIQPLGLSSSSNYFAGFQNDQLRYMSGASQSVLNNIDVDQAGYAGALNYVEFNNAKFLAMADLRLIGTFYDAARLVVYDITNPTNYLLKTSNSNFADFRIFASEEIKAGVSNGNATSDVCFGVSADGETMQAYLLLTNGGVLAQEFTKYSLK
ncbi:DUF5018 domain-containing protein [Sphingobacterium sp. MYb382]|uniref:DUF5018 domain-containing protein n=1 Tax=Sphingobacterium sp. MYb382 TaxID=2745278 RepID=UPI0030B452E3